MNRRVILHLIGSGAAAALLLSSKCQPIRPSVRVGSKAFTESVLLGELTTQLLNTSGVPAVHRRELGGTRVLWDALARGEIDLYPEYTGTIAEELLAAPQADDRASLERALERSGVRIGSSFGFDDSYAIGMRREVAARLGIRALSDLAMHRELKLGFSHEFMDRAEGWRSLRSRYHLPQTDVRGLDHELAYRALASNSIQATDLYSTDPEILQYDLVLLQDDLKHFPRYQAVLLYRVALERQIPELAPILNRLEGQVSAAEMIRMNAQAKLNRLPEAELAAEFLRRKLGVESSPKREGIWTRLRQRTAEHLFLVAVSLGSAILVSIPLGVIAAKRRRLGQVIRSRAGTIQTIPSLALLVFMIPLLGIGPLPAIVALFLYSQLPIIRNTCSGLLGIAPEVRESAEALGLPAGARLRLVELPIASPTILAGIKTSAVINVGTATLGALIGAGGYGQPILTGIRLDNLGLILEGAVPAALLALGVQAVFELLEPALVPSGLRLSETSPARQSGLG
jgi:osmoprotectant transport system permease protein